MKIAVDARELTDKPTGVGRYLAEILAGWTQSADAADVEVTLFSHRPLPVLARLTDSSSFPVGARITSAITPGDGRLLWEQWTLPRAVGRRFDVLFCPGYSGPLLARIPLVVTIHDVSFCAHPEWFRWKEGLRRRQTTKATARKAAYVIADAEFSAYEIGRWLHVSDARIRVIPLGLGGTFESETSATPVAGSAWTSGRDPLTLHVGSLFNRRHVDELIRAFARVRAHVPGATLAIVGDNRTYPPIDYDALIRELGLQDAVSLFSYVPDAHLHALYRRARAFAYLSTYEGFGLPPLEALRAGVPIVVYDTPLAREVYREAALYVRPHDLDTLSSTLTRLLQEEEIGRRQLAAATPVLASYSWADTAARTLAVLREAQ